MAAQAPCVKVEREGGLAIVTLDDGKANAISPQLERELSAAIDDAAMRGEALVVAGRPGRFCAGYDLSVMGSGPQAAMELMRSGADLLLSLFSHPRPVVAACTGHAIAARGCAVGLRPAHRALGSRGHLKVLPWRSNSRRSSAANLPGSVVRRKSMRISTKRMGSSTWG